MKRLYRTGQILAAVILPLAAVAVLPSAAQGASNCTTTDFSTFSNPDGTVKGTPTVTSCKTSSTTWTTTIHYLLADTLCDNRTARFDYSVYDEHGVYHTRPWTILGTGCGTSHTYTETFAGAKTAHGSMHIEQQACSANFNCSQRYSTNADWWGPA